MEFVELLNTIKRDVKNNPGIWVCDNEILCSTEQEAETIAYLLRTLGFDLVMSGYYDPETDECADAVSIRAGHYYVAEEVPMILQDDEDASKVLLDDEVMLNKYMSFNGKKCIVTLEHTIFGQQTHHIPKLKVVIDDEKVGLMMRRQTIYIPRQDITLFKCNDKSCVIESKRQRIIVELI